MRLTIVVFFVASSVYLIPANAREIDRESDTINTDYVYKLGREATESKDLQQLLKIDELINCYKEYGLDPGNLPNVEDISKDRQTIIFNSCNHLFNVPIIALKKQGLYHHTTTHQDNRASHSRSRRSHSISRHTKTRKTYIDPTTVPSGSASQPIEVVVRFDGFNIVREVLRLQFLFLNTFFSSLSGCIEDDEVETSMCLLNSFSSAFSVLSIELSDNN